MMTGSLDYVWMHRGPIAVLLVVAFGAIAIVQWLAWIFRGGRFRLQPGRAVASRAGAGYLFSDFLVKIITDFRNLLALVIVGIFAITLAISMYPGVRHWNVEEIGKGVQAIAAALGGLIGSIIGYYFGEAAGSRAGSGPPPLADTTTPAEAPVTIDAQIANAGVVPAPPPPVAQTQPPAPGGQEG